MTDDAAMSWRVKRSIETIKKILPRTCKLTAYIVYHIPEHVPKCNDFYIGTDRPIHKHERRTRNMQRYFKMYSLAKLLLPLIEAIWSKITRVSYFLFFFLQYMPTTLHLDAFKRAHSLFHTHTHTHTHLSDLSPYTAMKVLRFSICLHGNA